MKRYKIIVVFLLMALPLFVQAEDIDKFVCDNAPYEYFVEHLSDWDKGEGKRKENLYLLGTKDNRAIYKQEAFKFCEEFKYCTYRLKGHYYFGYELEDYVALNYPTFALFLNNKELFEAFINRDEFRFLLDNGLAQAETHYENSHFYTQALLAVRYSQVGILEYLIENYDVNLLKLSGYLYDKEYTNVPTENADVKEQLRRAKEYWAGKKDERGLKCAEMTEKVVNKWLKEHANEERYIKEAQQYNERLKYWSDKHRLIENLDNDDEDRPVNLFETKENYTLQIDNKIDNLQIDILIQKIMRGLDLSIFGNKKA